MKSHKSKKVKCKDLKKVNAGTTAVEYGLIGGLESLGPIPLGNTPAVKL